MRLSSRTFATLLVLGAQTVACKAQQSPNASSVREAVVAPPSEAHSGPALIETILAEGTDRHAAKWVLPSELFESMGQGPESRAARVQALATLLRGVIEKVPGLKLENAVSGSFDVPVETVKGWLAAAGVSLPDPYTVVADQLDAKMAAEPTLLDRFPTLSLDDVPLFQGGLFNKAELAELSGPPRAYPRDTATDITFGDDGCTLPSWEHTPTKINSAVFEGRPPIDQKIVPCFHANNQVFADLLNRFANTFPGAEGAQAEAFKANVTFPKTGNAALDVGSEITSVDALMKALSDRGYEIEIYTTRVVADFLGYNVPDTEGVYHPLRLSVWISSRVDGHPTRIPAEHGEIGILIQKNGLRLAQARYYLGVPDPKYTGVGSYWRPHTEKDFGWLGVTHERVESYSGANLSGIRPWMEAVSNAMRGFQAAHDRFNLPFNAYGVFVCSDSQVLAAAERQKLDGTLTSRTVNIFPIVRSGSMSVHGTQVNAEALVAQYAGLSLEELNAVYPSDQALVKDPVKFHERLRQAYPTNLDGRFAAFPEFVTTLNQNIRN